MMIKDLKCLVARLGLNPLGPSATYMRCFTMAMVSATLGFISIRLAWRLSVVNYLKLKRQKKNDRQA